MSFPDGGLDGVAEDLRALDADVIALQEVERGMGRPRSRDQAGELARRLGMHHAFGASFVANSGEHGIAVLSRHPILDARVVPLPQGTGRLPRSAVVAHIAAPEDTVLFVSVHLERPWEWPLANTRTRLAQVDSLLACVDADSLPAIVAGDFNCFPFLAEDWSMRRRLRCAHRPWRDGWSATFPLHAIGWPFGSIPIDRIYHDASYESRGCWVAAAGASDHRALVADLAPHREAAVSRRPLRPPGREPGERDAKLGGGEISEAIEIFRREAARG